MNIVNLDYLKNYMQKNNLSEYEFAKQIGVSYPMVNRVFRGKRNPGAKFIAGLIQLGLDKDKIFLPKPLPDGNSKGDNVATG